MRRNGLCFAAGNLPVLRIFEINTMALLDQQMFVSASSRMTPFSRRNAEADVCVLTPIERDIWDFFRPGGTRRDQGCSNTTYP